MIRIIPPITAIETIAETITETITESITESITETIAESITETIAESIAEAPSIRELHRLRQQYGPGRWRKKKGVALVETEDGANQLAEIHWYEAHGIGKVKTKVKRWL